MLPGLLDPGLTLTPIQALDEKKQREHARRNFLAYCQYVDPRYEATRHIRFLASKLQQVALYIASGGKQGIGRLMILMPPQHGKSQIASRNFPAWLLGLLPDSHVILTSYGESLATRHSRFIRDQIIDERYQAIFGTKSDKMVPVELSSDSRSTEAWDLARPYRGGVKAAGVGGGITGLPAHLFIVDDPFKNREEAESETRRELVDDWYKSSSRTRLRPNAAVVIFHTRWHPDDLAGRLMQRMVNDPLASQFEIVCLPGLALDSYPTPEEQLNKMREGVYIPLSDALGRQPGEALCPEWYPADWLISTRADVGLYDFEALYQQLPYLKEGGMFKREYFTIVDRVPQDVTLSKFTWYWDKAATAGKGDYSAGVLMAMGSDNMIYVLHAVRGKLSPHDRDNLIISEARASINQWKTASLKVFHQKDPAAAGKESAQSTNLKLAQAGLSGAFEPVTGDKEDRAGPWQSSLQGGGVRLLRAAWNNPYIDEHLAFPNGKNDDWVDCSSSCHFKVRVVMMKDVKSYQG